MSDRSPEDKGLNTRWSDYYGDNEQRSDLDLTKTLYGTLKAVVAEHPERVAIEYGKVHITYGALLEHIENAAAAFAARGIGKGDKVALCNTGVPSTIISLYALNKIGAVVCMVSHKCPKNRFVEHMKQTGCRTAIMSADMFGEFYTLLGDTQITNVIITRVRDYFTIRDRMGMAIIKLTARDRFRYDQSLLPEGFTMIMWDRLMKDRGDYPDVEEAKRDIEDTSHIFFTGNAGDTQAPVCVSDSAVNNEISLQMFMIGEASGDGDRPLKIMSFVEKAFIYGFCTGIHLPLISGNTIVLCADHNISFPVAEFNFYKPDVFIGYPSIVSGLTGNSRIHDSALASLKTILSGGDLFAGAQLSKVGTYLRERGCTAKIYQTYGTAETMSVCIFKESGDDAERLLGIPLPGVAVKVCERDTMGEMPVGRKGEICVLTPARISGYYDNEDADNRFLRHQPDGRVWVMTGDIGHMDERGMIYFDGNSGRNFERLGSQIYPQLIESEIRNVYGVTDVCVVPVDNPDGSIDIVAVVVPMSDYLFNNDRLRNIKSSIELECSLLLPAVMCPDDVEFRAYIPKGAYGRPDYKQIAESVAENRRKSDAFFAQDMR